MIEELYSLNKIKLKILSSSCNTILLLLQLLLLLLLLLLFYVFKEDFLIFLI